MDSLNDISGFQKGYAYHFITAGDVDAMSYLRLIMRYCGKIRHLLVSTWVMAEEDVRQFQEWLESGRIAKADFYVGEIFPGSYIVEYSHLKNSPLSMAGLPYFGIIQRLLPVKLRISHSSVRCRPISTQIHELSKALSPSMKVCIASIMNILTA
jgi:hypothetical protein